MSRTSLGAEVTLLHERRRAAVPIVGVIEEVGESALYTGSAGFFAISGLDGTVGELRVTVDAEPRVVAAALKDALLAGGWFPIDVMTHDSYVEALRDHFMILIVTLTLIACTAIVVGALGLATSMSLGVLERTREIRALGASRRVVLRVVLIEGLALAMVSAALALLLALPLSLAVCRVVGSVGCAPRSRWSGRPRPRSSGSRWRRSWRPSRASARPARRSARPCVMSSSTNERMAQVAELEAAGALAPIKVRLLRVATGQPIWATSTAAGDGASSASSPVAPTTRG